MNIAIVITNPNHHLEMTIDAAKKLKEMGHDPFYVSLCEFRRMTTPVEKLESYNIPFFKQKPISEDLKPSSGASTLGSNQSFLRKILREIFWRIKLKPFITSSLKAADVVLLMNDTAFPGDRISSHLISRKIPFCLMQEGIRFPLPGEGGSSYGSAGASKLFVWGQRSAQYFRQVAKSQTEVVITGSPRFDTFLKEMRLLEDPNERILGVFTNPIDDQGFCNKQQKLDLFESFVRRSESYLRSKEVILGVKCHPREDINEYLDIANKYVETVSLDRDIKRAIGQVQAGVIMASTVGLELLGSNKSLGQLEIPGYGWVFDYTESESVLKIPVDGDFNLDLLFVEKVESDYFRQHILFNHSADRIANQLLLC